MDSRYQELEKMGSTRNPVQNTEFQTLASQQPKAPDLNAGVDFAKQNTANIGSLMNTFTGQTNDLINHYSSTIGSQEGQAAMAARLGQELNLPTLNKNAFSLQQSLYDIPTTQNALTRGFCTSLLAAVS